MVTGFRVYLRPPRRGDAAAFVAASLRSRREHGGWTSAPATRERFVAFVDHFAAGAALPTHASFLMLARDDDAIAGVFNFSEIVRGSFRSAYLGYYGFSPYIGHGFMREGMALALDAAFRQLQLHRVEANIQPANVRSVALAERTGFTQEGFSRRYVKIGGRWRDHLRFAMLAEDWRTLRKRRG